MKDLVPQACPISDAHWKSGVSQTYLHFCLTGYKFRASHNTLRCDHLLERLIELMKALSWQLLFYYIGYKQPGEKVHRARLEEPLMQGASVPVESACSHPLGANQEAPSSLVFRDFNHVCIIWSWWIKLLSTWLNSIPSPLSSLEERDELRILTLLVSLPWPVAPQPLFRAHYESPHSINARIAEVTHYE